MSNIHAFPLSAPSSAKSAPAEIWYTRCPLPAASGIAQRQRWLHQEFARHGIGVETIRTSPDRAVRDSHFTHDQPNLFREGGPVPPIWTRARGAQTALVGITWIEEARAVLVRGDSQVRRLTDLRGRRLALPRHETRYADHARAHTLRGFLAALEPAGLGRDDVVFVDIHEGEYEITEPPVAVNQTRFANLDALLAGQVDAIYVKGARARQFIAEHGLRALPEVDGLDDTGPRLALGTPRPITVNRDLAITHPEVVARYLAVLQQTANWAARYPDEALEVIAAEIGTPVPRVRAGFGPNLHRLLGVSLDEAPVAALRAEKDFLLAHGFIEADVDFDSWIVTEPLQLAGELVAERGLPVAV